MARILEELPDLAGHVQRDLIGPRRNGVGRRGLDGDQVLRIALLKLIELSRRGSELIWPARTAPR